ncbi:hypothetical protein [Caulobacter hibisci]|uniref:Uncharacterized protein n=1 Tax=Caulobacter hibisci TaxID=2035993 RepID=A0ABS0T1I4_9CAUL|nr:hypothetical protein [Caulobacter hibisci]MBI1685742.1 hypothetical protein [Caulobacter hibisci]
MATSKDCRARADRPLRRWSKCGIFLIRDTDQVQLEQDDKGHWAWRPQDALLAFRDPIILQTRDPQKASAAYEYRAVTPVAFDGMGRVVAFHFALLYCEDFDAPEDAEGRRPLKPGLSWKVEGANCVAESEAALMAAAAAEVKADRDDPAEMRWVREVRPDDFAKARR